MMILLDQGTIEQILEDRRAKGNRTREEVWDGVTYIVPEEVFAALPRVYKEQ